MITCSQIGQWWDSIPINRRRTMLALRYPIASMRFRRLPPVPMRKVILIYAERKNVPCNSHAAVQK